MYRLSGEVYGERKSGKKRNKAIGHFETDIFTPIPKCRPLLLWRLPWSEIRERARNTTRLGVCNQKYNPERNESNDKSGNNSSSIDHDVVYLVGFLRPTTSITLLQVRGKKFKPMDRRRIDCEVDIVNEDGTFYSTLCNEVLVKNTNISSSPIG